MIYTVTFNPALDYVIGMDQVVLGEINRTTKEEIYYGGKGINVSRVLHTLGYSSTALGFVAGFTGREIEDGVRRLGIETRFIHLDQGLSRINVKIKSKQETDINGQGPEINQEKLEELMMQLDGLNQEDTLVLAGSIPSTLPDDIYEKIMARLEGKQVRIVVDATRDLLVNVLKYHPFLIKPNNHELGEILGKILKTDDEIAKGARELQKQGAENVLVSMAGDGALLVTKDGQVYKIGVPEGTVKNSVGAGDSMVAGFLAGLMESGEYLRALRMGTAAGSATAFSEDLAERELILDLLQQI